MSSKVSFRIPRLQQPKTLEETNINKWYADLTKTINMLVDSVNSVGSYIS